MLAELKKQPELKTVEFPPPWPEILAHAQRLIGTPRYLSVHPGGVVITPRPIDDYVPVEHAPKGVPIIQWEKDAAEDAGLVKIDILGNRSLGVIRDALANLQANGAAVDETRWEPEDDLATQASVAQGRTMGCFYIESPAMRLLQQKSRVGDFEHLVIHSSIIRPAANDYIREYIRRLHGGPWDPIHPRLTDVLEETFGIMVYQEDVSRDGGGARRVLPRRGRRPAQDPLQEGPGTATAGLCPALPGGRPGAGGFRSADHGDLGHDDELRRVFVLQAPQRLLRAGFVPGGVSQGPPPGRVHGGGDQQPGRVLQRLRLCLGSPAPGP